MSRAKLKNAPLKEVIFELFWDMTPSAVGAMPTDSQYDLALGSFADKIKAHFPTRKRTMPEGIKIYPKPEYQFWKGELIWPVIQLGPGMLAVNDTDKNYSWDKNFKSNIQLAIQTLSESYEEQPKFNRIKLQYINAIELPELDAEKFIKEKLLTSVVRKNTIPGTTKGLQILQLFEQEDGAILTINIQTGLNSLTKLTSVVWTLTVESMQPMDDRKIDEWLDRAHNLTSNTFVSMLEPSFYASFDN